MTALHPGRARHAHTDERQAATMPRNVEIRVRGKLPAGAAESLGLTAAVERTDTLLRGPLVDRAALLGVLDRLRCNGIELIDLRRIPDHGDDTPRSGR
jgi:hypothetical protein